MTAADGGAGVGGVQVQVLDGVSTVASATTGSDGRYRATGLPPSNAGYTLCFGAAGAADAPTTGYADQCYAGVAWTEGGAIPDGLTPVPVQAGRTSAGVSVALLTAGEISGRVRALAGRAPLSQVSVSAFAGSAYGFARTGPDGTYTISRLSPSANGYTVCFEVSEATGGASRTGYVAQCYENVTWDTFGGPPDGTTRVPVGSGAISDGVDASIRTGAAIRGTVTADGEPVGGVEVRTASGADAQTRADGTYTIEGVPSSSRGTEVCFYPPQGTPWQPEPNLASQCYAGVPTNPHAPVPAAMRVATQAGDTTRRIDAALQPGATVTGTVTSAATGDGVDGSLVYVFDRRGVYQTFGSTQSDGTYEIEGLAPSSSGYTVCFQASTGVDSGDGHFGFHDMCYRGVAWDGARPPPRGTPVPVTSGGSADDISAALAPS